MFQLVELYSFLLEFIFFSFFKIIYYHEGASITRNNWVRVSSRLSICSDFKNSSGKPYPFGSNNYTGKNKCSFLNCPKYFIEKQSIEKRNILIRTHLLCMQQLKKLTDY